MCKWPIVNDLEPLTITKQACEVVRDKGAFLKDNILKILLNTCVYLLFHYEVVSLPFIKNYKRSFRKGITSVYKYHEINDLEEAIRHYLG